MKSIIKFAIVTLGLALGATASAETYVRITGSTAFRSATMNAIKNSVDMTRNTGTFSNASANDGYGYDGTALTKANFGIFRGLLKVNGVTQNIHVIVKANWSGSVQGVKDVTQGNSIKFFTDTVVATLDNSTGTSGLAAPTNTEIPDVCMADNKQSETTFTSPALTLATTSFTPGLIGIVPFAWVAGNGAPAGLTNVTPQLVQQLFKNGNLDGALFTNNVADATVDAAGNPNASGTMVYAMGRNPYSGTHVNYFAESGLGIKSPASQFYPWNNTAFPGGTWTAPGTVMITAGTNYVVTDVAITPADPAFGALNDGDNGYDSGGRLADILRGDYSNITDDTLGYAGKACAITALGEGDAVNLVFGNQFGATSTVVGGNAGNGRFLTWSGVPGWGGHPFTSSTGGTAPTVDGANHVILHGSDVTTGLIAGQFVKPNGTNIPAPAYIVSVDSSTQLTLGFWLTPSGLTGAGSTPTTVLGTLSGALTISTLLPEAVRNGNYSFWGYEYMLYKEADTNSISMINSIAKQAATVDYFASGYHQKYMRVNRTGAGKPIFNNY
jgi:hypothetical protein